MRPAIPHEDCLGFGPARHYECVVHLPFCCSSLSIFDGINAARIHSVSSSHLLGSFLYHTVVHLGPLVVGDDRLTGAIVQDPDLAIPAVDGEFGSRRRYGKGHGKGLFLNQVIERSVKFRSITDPIPSRRRRRPDGGMFFSTLSSTTGPTIGPIPQLNDALPIATDGTVVYGVVRQRRHGRRMKPDDLHRERGEAHSGKHINGPDAGVLALR